MNIRTLITIAVAALLTACSSSKSSLQYFQNLPSPETSIMSSSAFGLKIEPNDELVITVTSAQPEATAAFNLPMTNPATLGAIKMSSSAQQQTYIVDTKGDIKFPVFGYLHVAGLTTTQLAEKITELVSQSVQDPHVRVELVNFRVAVLGEVKKPGPQTVVTERYSLIDALASAGDLTEYGMRDKVLLIREEDGKKVYHFFNINDAKTLADPYYYLKQNDAIYVYPNEIRQSNSRYNTYNSYKIQIVSTVVSASSVLASLIIALAIK